MNITYISR